MTSRRARCETCFKGSRAARPVGNHPRAEDRPIYDIAVVGAGIVGLATGYRLLARHPHLRLVVLEKEAEPAAHQTGHNSGVVHTGVYYRPGSLKARLCVEGARRLKVFCSANGIPYEQCGKVIVATSKSERAVLGEIARRGIENGVEGLRELDADGLRDVEPHAAGIAALHVPGAAAVDFRAVAQALAARIAKMGGVLQTRAAVRQVQRDGRRLLVETGAGEIRSRFLINCAGLYADRVARAAGAELSVQILPFRGEYYVLREARRGLVNGMIYPVPDSRFPFLGVHFTRTVDGRVEAGPNAVFAFAREGYSMRTVRPSDLWEALAYPGFWMLARRYWRTGVAEFWRSARKGAFVRALQRLVPDVTAADVRRGGAGVRAQAVSADGKMVDDFVFADSPCAIHVLNAPSPAASACLAIGDYLSDVATTQFELDASATGSPRQDASASAGDGR